MILSLGDSLKSSHSRRFEKKRKKIDLGQLTTLLANIGVLVGIGFLAYELRQNTNAVQSATFQGYSEGTIDWMTHVSGDPELSSLWRRYVTGSDDLDDVELWRAAQLVRMQWIRYQNAFSQRQRGSLNGSDWEVSAVQICRESGDQPVEGLGGTSPGLAAKLRRETWTEHRPYLNQEFIDFVEGEECWALATDRP
jgi:hypothetical protein